MRCVLDLEPVEGRGWAARCSEHKTTAEGISKGDAYANTIALCARSVEPVREGT